MEKDEYRIMHDIEQSYWWFVGKQFLVKSILKGFSLNNPKQNRILDIGCGTGIILKLAESFGLAYGMELSSEAIRFLRKRDLNLVTRSDANQSLPFKSNTFSAITCLDLLEHLDNDFDLLKEIFRVCKPRGHLVVTVPAFDIQWSPHDIALHHKRRYTKAQMLKMIREFDWKVLKCSYYNTILFLPILAIRKLKTRLSDNTHGRSDFFIKLPACVNRALSLLFVSEIRCLKYLNLPFGVSLFLILQKPEGAELKPQ
ncbi:MAG: class I SAM-dependent methyltransferase [Desulfobacterales bacterium]|nr:class I SAM-dependent methyltransferase [Desulfobacterales bacterium]